MVRRLVRHVVAIALGLALWFAASGARAADFRAAGSVGAPMCDFHGASVNAPAPLLETPQSATEISMGTDAAAVCDALPGLDARFPGRLHRAAPREDADPDRNACALPPVTFLAPRVSARLGAFAKTRGARPGTRSSVDRPPRAR